MTQNNIRAQELGIPDTLGFDAKALNEKGQFVIITNQIYAGENQAPKSSGVSNEVFFDMLHGYASDNGEMIVMADENVIYMSGDEFRLSQLILECEIHFDCDFADLDGLKEHNFHEFEAKEDTISLELAP